MAANHLLLHEKIDFNLLIIDFNHTFIEHLTSKTMSIEYRLEYFI